ncbi:hypothetical protein VIGAN_09041600 [Vigna angularis var. angularis]|uniref:Uncharacterized protein n=1 Tax=Vigna angularis var. angularis TaxID=157739 RepID=A0A0S3SWC9_PHAAN|nr:hypothetical protein VIGAN_09041600 [Vigna angularis var. angularis]
MEGYGGCGGFERESTRWASGLAGRAAPARWATGSWSLGHWFLVVGPLVRSGWATGSLGHWFLVAGPLMRSGWATVELFESSDDEWESPKSPSEQEGSSDYVSVKKFQEVLAELDRERQARFAAENLMSKLQVSLNQLKKLNQEAIKKDDEFDCLGDDIFHENDEMLKEPEEIEKKDVLQLKIGNSSHMIVTGKEKILKKGKHENEDVEMNLITKKMILKNQEDPTIDESNKFGVGYMKQKRDKG